MQGAMIIGVIIMFISRMVSGKLQSKFRHYSQLSLQNGMSGKEIAEKMLADNDIYDVKVISVRGQLTDHYNPRNKTVNLSEVVYHQRNAAAAAVSAHECGHAIQHNIAYKWLTMRSRLVPAVNISSKFMQWIIYAGLGLVASGIQLGSTVLLIGVLMFAMTTVFSLVTLPVEYDASNRAMRWLTENNMVNQEEEDGARDALKWAARTYLVAAIGSIGTLLYYIMLYLRARR